MCTESITVHFRHHDVTQDNVGHYPVNLRQSLLTVQECLYLIVLLKLFSQEVAYLVIVFDDHNSRLLIRRLHDRLLFGDLSVILDDTQQMLFRLHLLLLTVNHLFRFQVFIAQRDADGELTAFLQVLCRNHAIVKLNQ